MSGFQQLLEEASKTQLAVKESMLTYDKAFANHPTFRSVDRSTGPPCPAAMPHGGSPVNPMCPGVQDCGKVPCYIDSELGHMTYSGQRAVRRCHTAKAQQAVWELSCGS